MSLIDVAMVPTRPVCCPNAPALTDPQGGGRWEEGLANPQASLFKQSAMSPEWRGGLWVKQSLFAVGKGVGR